MHYCDQTTRKVPLDVVFGRGVGKSSQLMMQMADCHANFLTTVLGNFLGDFLPLCVVFLARCFGMTISLQSHRTSEMCKMEELFRF